MSPCQREKTREEILTAVLFSILVEHVDIVGAGIEWTVASANGLAKVRGNQIGDLDVGRGPPRTVETTIQPGDGTVGTASSGDILYSED